MTENLSIGKCLDVPHQVKQRVAQTISNLLHPLLMLTYAAACECLFTPLSVLPAGVRWLFVGQVFVYTCLIPCTLIWVMYKAGLVSHYALRDRRDRALPLFVNAFAYVLCALALSCAGFMPAWALCFYFGAVCMAFSCWLVSLWWKISAHATAVSALLTASILLYIRFPLITPLWIVFVLLILSGLLGTIRIYLGRHTLAQVMAGYAMGAFWIVVSWRLWV